MSRTQTFRRQHGELQRIAAELTKLALVPGTPAESIRATLGRFVGKLRVHARMETDALYPRLMTHEDAEIRRRSERLHAELGPLYGLVDEFVERWGTAEAIDQRRIRFRIDLARMLAKLGWRMRRENEELYPMADALE